MKRQPETASNERRKTLKLEIVHTDLCGPLQPSREGFKYILTFIDDFSRMTWVYLLRKKSDTFSIFLEWQAMVERQSGERVKILRSDKDGEYMAGDFRAYFSQKGICSEFSQAGTPSQNGVAERYNQTLLYDVASMLHGANVSGFLWSEAVMNANHTRMRGPHSALDTTPFEQWHGRAPSCKHTRAFGCRVKRNFERN
jgi:transposase InsO family protein